jgi:hypothetical protein
MRFAAGHGWSCTRPKLRAATTYEVLLRETTPLAELTLNAGLTRRDLDLGLRMAAQLGDRPAQGHARLLRG